MRSQRRTFNITLNVAVIFRIFHAIGTHSNTLIIVASNHVWLSGLAVEYRHIHWIQVLSSTQLFFFFFLKFIF